MKVLHLSSEKGWRGGEQQIAYLLLELSKAGVQNFVAAREGSDFAIFCGKNSIPVFGVPFGSSVDPRTALRIKTICTQECIDLIHMHSAKSHSLGVLSAVLGNSTPLILSRRVDFVPGNGWFTKWKYNHSSIRRIVCVSHKIDSIMRSYLNDPEKSLTIHSGVDLTRFTPDRQKNQLRKEFHVHPESFLIGNSSALEGHKDYFTFIRTIDVLIRRRRDVRGLIMGSGSMEGALRDYVNSLSLNSKITFTGFRKDIVSVLPELDLFLMTSNEEGLGTSVLDAFVAKVPVVATRAGGIPEMVIHGKSGLLASIGDAEQLAGNIEKIMDDSITRVRLVDGAAELVKEFSKEKTAQKTLEIYREVLSERG